VPVFTLDPVVCNNEIFNLSPLASGIAGPGMVDWIIDGVPTYSTAANVNSTHSFIETSTNLSETHTVVLSIEDRNGCVTVSDPFEITVSLPQANYTNVFHQIRKVAEAALHVRQLLQQLQMIHNQLEISFNGVGVLEMEVFLMTKNAQNTYVFGGTYDLTLNVTDEFGCSASIVTAPFLQIDGQAHDLPLLKI
jgi:hypothetical protein